jgi:hypothetical protein
MRVELDTISETQRELLPAMSDDMRNLTLRQPEAEGAHQQQGGKEGEGERY